MVFDESELAVRCDYAALAGEAVHPNECMLFSDSQLRCPKNHGAGTTALDAPEPFELEAKIPWIPALSMISGKRRYLPMALCLADVPSADGGKYCRTDSNGVAAGSSLRDAVVRAFLEVVERDAVGIWWYNRIARTCYEITEGADEQCARIARAVVSRGRDIWLCEVTSDIGIPVWVAVSSNPGGGDLWFGFGCDFVVQHAVRKALLELCHRLPFGRGRAVHNTPAPHLRDLPFLKSGSPGSLYGGSGADFRKRDELETVLSSAAEAGMDLIALNLTRPDIGIPVARVIVPGMRHLQPRFAPGRMFDIPVRMEWLSVPRAETDLQTHSLLS